MKQPENTSFSNKHTNFDSIENNVNDTSDIQKDTSIAEINTVNDITESNDTKFEQGKKDLNALEIAKNEMRKGCLFLIDESGSVKIGKEIFHLGPEFSKSFLYKIDSNKFGILRKFVISEVVQELVKDFTHIITISPDGETTVSPFAVETMITKREDESEENYKFRTLLHQNSLSSSARIGLVKRRIESATKLSLNNLNHREKISLTNYYLSNSNQHHYELVNFAKQYGINGLKTFLACEYGMDMGKKIIALGENLPSEIAEKIFAKYVELAGFAEDVSKNLEEYFSHKKSTLSNDSTQKIQEQLLKAGKELLAGLDANNSLSTNDLLEKLEEIKGEIILFANIFREAKKTNPELALQDIEKSQLINSSAESLSAQDKQEMTKIFLDNRRENTAYSATLLEQLTQEFNDSLSSADSQFYILKYNDEIVSFIRFEKLPNGNTYAGSFNVQKSGAGSGIGTEMMRTVLEKKAQDADIEAVCIKDNPALKMYQEKFGFQIIDEEENYHGTGATYYRLLKPRVEIQKQAA